MTGKDGFVYDIAVIGGGVTGCAVAREACRYGLKVLLLEKAADVCEGISKANSGVLHAGFNVKPGSLKARFNIEGLRLFPSLAEEIGVDYRICGKLVAASGPEQFPYLERLMEQGIKNGCSGLSIIGKDEARRLEPNINAERALFSESTGIVSPFGFTIALAENAAENGADFRFSTRVVSVKKESTWLRLKTLTQSGPADFRSRRVVNCSGINAADLMKACGTAAPEVFPVKGEYYITDKTASGLLGRPVYPVPPADGSGLGVHLTPTLNGNILIGPSADYVPDPDDTSSTAGIMALLKKEACALLPQLSGLSFIKNYAGMRPKLFKPGVGSGFADFYIKESETHPGMINLLGMESPGLTGAPAVAAYVIRELIGSAEDLRPDPGFNPVRKRIPRAATASAQELQKLIEKDPEYAEIICRCEMISKAEIRRAIENPLGTRSLNAVKKRTYAMMGRCQSGFCLPRIADILIEEYGLSPESITADLPDSAFFTGRHGGKDRE